ncbi:hypothetical protein P4V86_16980 [Brevibacillus laterosporus]|nr:hypothetical protein [Brevibacillus laterosporus]MED2005039.1 hypothetical protein [Brevibacillus laterosporus]MED4765379.1 hypothetical protein [Brevibacillus laterosporus]
MKTNQLNKLFNEIEKYFQALSKTRAIQISLEKKIKMQVDLARQAMK